MYCILGIGGFFGINWIYQVIRKPGEIFAPIKRFLIKEPGDHLADLRITVRETFYKYYFTLLASRASDAVNPYRLLALTDRENQRLLKAIPCANGVQWFRLGIESGDLKQGDTFFKNLLPAQICASSGPIDGSVELNLDYFAFLAESKVCLREKLSDGLRWFSWGSAWLFTEKGRRGQNAPG